MEPLINSVGHNIELMDKHFPISSFDAVYLIDLCDSLLDVARRRFAQKGWKNVIVLCQDASEFSLRVVRRYRPKRQCRVYYHELFPLHGAFPSVIFLHPALLDPDSELLRRSRPNRTRSLTSRWSLRCCRLLYRRQTAFAPRKSHRWDQQRMRMALAVVLADLVRLRSYLINEKSELVGVQQNINPF